MLSSEDAYKIEQLARLFPEIKAELDAIEDALLNAANEVEEAPSPAVKDQLFSRLRQLPTDSDTTILSDTAKPSEDHATGKVIPMYEPRRNTGLIAAAVVGGLLAVAKS